ncbi:MAG: RelA/SpoT family protein [Muribaculaceae bacterium]|nr:RelA/SpoT family protein [Muribaculaceae bacterium]
MATEYTYLDPESDARIVESEYQDLLDGYLRSNHRKKVEIIERAFRFARKAHAGIRRRSGEPYILHPIAVAKIVSQEMGLGSTSICAALLHDVVEDTEYTVEDIQQQFGAKIAQLVAGLTKISGGIFGDRASAQAENFRKLLLTMSEDIRVVLIKMADRLHNMRTLGSMAVNKQYKIAGETLYIYAPLAHRLGLYAIKTELEDLSFKYEHPDAYAEISRNIADTEEHRLSVFHDFIAPIEEKLIAEGIKYEAKARVKSVYSIWRKMQTKHVTFDEVYDLYAVRIIFDCDDRAEEKRLCWAIYGAITDLYRLHPDRVRDWVVNPKANGYQALHLTVMGPDGNWVEVQIRSRRMDEIAEKGFAAHWRYKIGEGDEESELTVWLRTIKDILEDPTPNAIDFLDTLKLNLFASEIVVFTPKGELMTLPNGATVLDMAYELHSQIGSKCIAGKVNHKLVPLSYKLQSGDQVEVLTSQSQKPKEEWLNIVTSAKALTSLRQALRREQQPVIEKGRDILRCFLEEGEVEPSNRIVTKITGYFKLANPEQLYIKLGQGEITLDNYVLKDSPKTSPGLLKKIFRIGTGKKALPVKEEQALLPAPVNTKEVYMLRYSEAGRNFELCDCCNPVPGDDVMGFVNDRGVVEVHSLSCPRASVLKAGFGPRIVATKWEKVEGNFPATVKITGIDRHGILQEITYLLATTPDLDLRSLHIDTDSEVFTCDLRVLVPNSGAVTSLCSRIKKISGVKSAVRLQE